MNVITNRQVLTEDTSNCCGMSSFDDYSYAKGKGKKVRSGKFKEKLQGGYTKVKEAGGLSFLENVLGLNQQAQNQGTMQGNQLTDPNLNIKVKEPMSNTTKILIGVGVAGAVGLAVWYFGFRKKNGK
jgi:hypothetical protein